MRSAGVTNAVINVLACGHCRINPVCLTLDTEILIPTWWNNFKICWERLKSIAFLAPVHEEVAKDTNRNITASDHHGMRRCWWFATLNIQALFLAAEFAI